MRHPPPQKETKLYTIWYGDSIRFGILLAACILIAYSVLQISIRGYADRLREQQSIQRSMLDLHEALIDQETGVRGYLLTGQDVFLEPYEKGNTKFEEIANALRLNPFSDPRLEASIETFIVMGESWNKRYGFLLVEKKALGQQVDSLELAAGKAAMDAIRLRADSIASLLDTMQDNERRGLRLTTGAALIALGLLSVLAVVAIIYRGIVLFRRLTLPIVELNNSVQSYASGDFETGLMENRTDELGQLVHNVNKMRLELKRKFQFHQDLLDMIQELQEPGGSLDQVYRTALKHMVELFQADTAILWVSEDGQSWEQKTKYWFGDWDNMGRPISAEELKEYGVQIGLPILFEDWNVSRPMGQREELLRVAGITSSLHIPIFHDERMMAVAHLGSLSSGQFQPEQVKDAIGVSQLIALAIRNIGYMEMLENQASRDGLTKLWNRRAFDQRLAELIQYSSEAGKPFSLILLDLDHFKSFNDTYGHIEGDRLLVHAASTINLALQGGGYPARYGGEEFAVLLPSTRLREAAQVAERIRASMEKDKLGDHLTTASFGVVEFRPRDDAASLLKRADKLLYLAKVRGRNLVEFGG